MGATFDGASVNRKLVWLHSHNNRLVNQILNPFSTNTFSSLILKQQIVGRQGHEHRRGYPL